jgi:hypothetical protein
MQENNVRTGWTGWVVFAALMLIIGGTLNAIYGLIAVLNDNWVAWGNRGAMLLNINHWGWVHLLLGLVVVLAGLGLMSGNLVGRLIGVLVASASLIVNFIVLPMYPLWSIILITIDALVIWALVVHGGEMALPPEE